MECLRARSFAWLRLRLVSLLLLTLHAHPARADFISFEVNAERLAGTDRTSGSTAVDAKLVQVQDEKVGVRFGLNVNADRDSGSAPEVESGVGRYTATFTIDNDRNYRLRLTVHRVGVVRRLVDQAGCSGSVLLAATDGPILKWNDDEQVALSALDLPEVSVEDGTAGAFVPVNDTATLEGPLGAAGTATYTLTFHISATAVSNTCAVAVLLGAQNASTTGCIICEYPGDRSSVDVDEEGLFLDLELIPNLCGDGNVQAGEQCDLGASNGAAQSCCKSDCTFRGQGEVCRPVDGNCDKAESCSGASGACGADEKQEDGFPCGPEEACSRSICQGNGFFCTKVAKSGPCDDGQFCTSGDQCNSGQQCVPGTSSPCAAGQMCDENLDACIASPTLPTLTLDVRPITRPLPGDSVRYTALVGNPGSVPATINWADPLPPSLTYVPGSLEAVEGTTDDSNPVNLRWSHTLAARGQIAIHFDAVIDPQASCPGMIENSAFARLPSEVGVQADARIDVRCTRMDPDPNACAGDCGGDDVVTVDELVAAVNDHLENPAGLSCAAVDTDGSGSVSLAEVKTGVETALDACRISLGGLAGSWSGPLYRLGSPAFASQQTVTLHADGTIDGILGERTAQLSLLNRPNRIYAFRRDDGSTGVLQFSPEGRHAIYLDELFLVGALEKDATGLALSYSRSDLEFPYSFGSVARYGPADRVAGENTAFTVEAAFPFHGLVDDTGVFALISDGPAFSSDSTLLDLSLDQDLAEIGTFEGNWRTLGGGPSGDAVFLMSPDKNFLAARTCAGPFPQCDFSAWLRLSGPFLATCAGCTIDDAPPTFRCHCLRSDGQTRSSSSIDLPCLKSIENDDGILTCR